MRSAYRPSRRSRRRLTLFPPLLPMVTTAQLLKRYGNPAASPAA